MTTGSLIVLALAVLAYAVHLLARRIDQQPAQPEPIFEEVAASEVIEGILACHGTRASEPWPWPRGVIHEDIQAALDAYECVAFDPFSKMLDRAAASRPSEFDGYLQIGVWPDGSELLAKCDPSDPRIYLADIEDCAPGAARVFAVSFAAALTQAHRDHAEVERHLRAK